jgi:hypothetical protein
MHDAREVVEQRNQMQITQGGSVESETEMRSNCTYM